MSVEQTQAGEASDMEAIILNNLNIGIYVSDMTTNRILFTNAEMQRIYGDNSLTGKVCWEALRNMSKRCEFCPIPYLLKNPGKSYQWKLRIKDRTFEINDSIIPWHDGGLVHLQYMIDITYRHSVPLVKAAL